MGGAEAVLALATEAEREGELRWAATLLNHLIFADETNRAAREKLAGVYAQLAFEAEAGTWRNIYLTGAQELRDGVIKLPAASMNTDMLSATTTSMLLDFAAVRIDPEKIAGPPVRINIELTDRGERHLLTVGNGVMVHEEGGAAPLAGVTIRMSKPDLLLSLFAGLPIATRISTGDMSATGNVALYESLAAAIEPLTPNFPIVTP
jgi:alkyl sulfatase BDS1-like metallo-beta-lactamase superfamily hydrolase